LLSWSKKVQDLNLDQELRDRVVKLTKRIREIDYKERVERIATAILAGSTAASERMCGGFSSMKMQVATAIEVAQELVKQLDALPPKTE